MASRTESQRVLSSGLNLLPPGDKIADGQALLLENFRTDQQGELRSTKGAVLESGPVGSGNFHTLARVGNDRYAGIGSQLWWNMGLAIASGFDGSRLGLVFYQGAGWIMNRLKQLRFVSGSVQKWGIDAPATAPVAAVGAQQLILLDSFEGSGPISAGGNTDAGYIDPTTSALNKFPSSKNFSAFQGSVSVVNGSANIVGSGTNWDNSLVSQTIQIAGRQSGSPATFIGTVGGVTDATHLVLVSPFTYTLDTGGGLAYEIYSLAAAINYDTTVFQQGSASLAVHGDVAANWFVKRHFDSPVDTRAQGVAQDDDEFRLWLYASNPGAIDSVMVTLFDVSGRTATVSLPGEAVVTRGISVTGGLSVVPNSWTRLGISRNLNATYWRRQIDEASATTLDSSGQEVSPDPVLLADLHNQFDQRVRRPHFTEFFNGETFTGVVFSQSAVWGGTAGYNGDANQPTSIDWSRISGLMVQVVLTAPTKLNLDYAYFVDNVPGSLAGTGEYFVSFANTQGEDSNPSPASEPVSCANQTVVLTGIPVSADPQVSARWIWRIGFGSSQALLVGKISDNVTTGPWYDPTPTAQAQNQGIVMPINRTPAPPARGVVGPYMGKLVAYNTDAHPARYFWTPAGQPWFFPGSDDEVLGNWEDAGNDDDPIVEITNHNRLLLIYKQRSRWRLVGDPATADAECADVTMGLVGRSAIANAGPTGDFMVGNEGIYLCNADNALKVSGPIDPIFKGDYLLLSNGEYLPPIEKSAISGCLLEIINDRLYFSYPESGQQQNSVTLVLNITLGTWTHRRVGVGPGGFSALHFEGTPYHLEAGVTIGGAGYQYSLEQGFTDGGAPIYLKWQSRFSDQGLPDNYKRYSDLKIDFQTGLGGELPSTLSVYVVYNNQIKVLLGTISANPRTTATFSLRNLGVPESDDQGLKAKNFAVRIEGATTSTCVIYGTYLEWYPEERIAISFDSGFTNLGQPERVKQVDYLELYATGSGQSATRVFSSDTPGALLVARDSGAATLPNGRGNVRNRLGAIVEGRNFRYAMRSPQPFQVHHLRVRQRVIGEYVDGTIGEYFESPEFSVAPGRDGELKDLLLDYDSSGPGQLIVYADSDPPGSAFALVRTLTLPGGSRRTFVFAFEDSAGVLPYGTLFKIRIVPPPGGITRLHGRATIRARIIGTSFDGAAGERWQTQPLDLFGGIAQFREVAIIAQTSGPMLFEMLTELPGEDMRVAASCIVNTPSSTSGRLPIYARLPGVVKGQLQQFRLTGPYATRLYEAKILGRGLGNVETDWTWRPLPVEPTPEEFQLIQVPVRETAEAFSWVEIPVDVIESQFAALVQGGY